MRKYFFFILFNIYVCLIQAQPAFNWAFQIGDTVGGGWGWGISTDENDNVYATGNFIGTVDFDPGPGVYSVTTNQTTMYVCKYNSNGNLIWLDTSYNDDGKNIIVRNDRVYVLSRALSVSKYDTAGNFIWRKKVLYASPRSIDLDHLGNIFITGSFSSTIDFDPGPGIFNLSPLGNSDVFILKLDSDGHFLWVKQFGGVEHDYAWSGDVGTSIRIDPFNNILIAGSFYDTVDFDPGPGIHELISIDNSDVFILKLDSDANFIWVKHVGAASYQDYADLAIDDLGYVYAAIHFFHDILLCKLDLSGITLWAKIIGSGINWTEQYFLALDKYQNIYLTGDFAGTSDFDPGSATYNLVSSMESNDVFLMQIDANGNFICAGNMGGICNDIGRSVAIDKNGNIYITGYFCGTADFDPGPSIYNLVSPLAQHKIFIAKYSNCLFTASQSSIPPTQSAISIFPNPTSGQFIIHHPEFSGSEISIYNYLGEKIHTQMLTSANQQINLSAEAKGIYFLQLQSGERKEMRKIILH